MYGRRCIKNMSANQLFEKLKRLDKSIIKMEVDKQQYKMIILMERNHDKAEVYILKDFEITEQATTTVKQADDLLKRFKDVK